MPDRESVIKALDCCLDIVRAGRWASGCIACPYAKRKPICRERMLVDAITLLKEQEPKFVEIDGQFGGIKYGRCPKCGEGLNEEVYPHWCGFCGQEVKWNA